jgi:uncharacterized protein YkwD
MTISRRVFLQSASASFGAVLLDHAPFATSPSDLEKTFAEIRANLLEMINEERAVAKVQPLVMDELATQVATKHAIDMATAEYASHWGRDGLKPYHRYSFAGGTHATQENISAADNTWSTKAKDLKQDTAYLHVRLYQEKPPYDWHRQTILAPQHTHVGFGLAVEQLRLRMVELFVAKYVDVTPLGRQAKPGSQVSFAAKMLKPDYALSHIEVFYEPLPKEPELSWLRQPRPYTFPSEAKVLQPKPPPPFFYADGSRGVIDVFPDGRFATPVTFSKEQPGIYTIVAWITTPRSQKAFPATEVCIRTE